MHGYGVSHLVDCDPRRLPAVETDFLVLGSGIAGLMAALHLAEGGEVLVAAKGGAAEGATYHAQGGIAAAVGPDDRPALHLRDTLRAGAGLCDRAAARVLVEEAPAAVGELVRLGVPLDREGEVLSLTREAAHSRRRVLHAGGDATGRLLGETLLARLGEHERVALREGWTAVDLLVERGRCRGALLLDERSGELLAARARAVLLATGGAGQLYRGTTNPPGSTGDGIAMAYRAGAAVADLEFLQFHPTVWRAGGCFLISEALRGEGALLLDGRGRRFMERLHPQAELAPRDVVARGIYLTMRGENSDHVYLDATALGRDYLHRRFPTIYETCLARGLDIAAQPIPVAPAAHYLMGGVVTDLDGATTLPGLYACGETACTGVHGANRLASNSLLEGAVFARRAARKMLGEEPPLPARGREEGIPFACRAAGGAAVDSLKERLQAVMEEKAGLLRSGGGLAAARQELAELAAALGHPRRREEIELANMLLVASLLVEAALERRESRGAHYRVDFPESRPGWRFHNHKLAAGAGSQERRWSDCLTG